MSSKLKNILETAYTLCDNLEKTDVWDKNNSARAREIFRGELFHFLLYLSFADTKISAKESQFIENNLGYKYSVKEIGSRPKAINDSNVKAIYYRDVPNIIFKEFETNEAIPSGYTYINVPAAYRSLFRESAKGKSANERIDELLQDHSCVAE